MTSIARQIKRRNPNYDKDAHRQPQYTEYHDDGSYTTLHPTNGWQRVSARRIRAQERMMEQFGFVR